MANRQETTFGDLQIDERYKKLRRSLKLAILKQEHSKGAHDRKTSSVTAWPSSSTINVDTLDSSSAAPSLQTSLIKSEVLASSINLRNMLLKKSSLNPALTKQETMTTSSVKQYHVQQDDQVDRLVMPPPTGNTVYRACKELPDRVHTLSNCKKEDSTLLNRSVQSSINTFSLKSTPSWISTNTNTDKEYSNTFVMPTMPTNNFQKVDRAFSKWRVMLNDQYELIIKGTLECGRIARSKPVIRRYSATCIESKYKHKYILQGNIVDERNGLPDYIRGKFYNGFPDDWENVYQIWRTYVSQGCPVMFRWPTPITDSDDDLKSELTDLTYACVKNKSGNLNDHTKSENLNDTSEKKEKYRNYSTRSLQNYEKNASFVKPFIFNSEKSVISVGVQTKNVKLLCDENNEQNVETDINPPSSSRKVNKLKDILQEDKLNIIINNLADRNCSQKYIDKIIKMFDCLDYVISYRTGSECNNDSVVSASDELETSKSETIPLQQSLMCDDNVNAKLENKLIDLKSYGHSTDLGYSSIRNDSNAIQLSNPVNVKLEHDKDSDKSESETYAGVPKISIGRVLRAREMSRKLYKRKVRKKTVYPALKNASNLSCNAEEVKFKSIHVASPVADAKKNSVSDESCISITEDEVEIINMREHHNTRDITQKPQKMMIENHKKRETQRNSFDVFEGGKSTPRMQNEKFEAQKATSNVFIKEQKIPYKNTQENAHSQFVTDVDYTTNSDVEVMTVSTNTRKTGRNMITSRAEVDQDIVITSESNSDYPEKPCASPKVRREFIEQTKSEIAKKKSKPTIISSMPVNLKISRISRIDPKTGQSHESKIIVKNQDKRDTNILLLEETDKKKSMLKTSIVTKPAINDSHSKTTVETVNNKRESPIISNKNESDNINPINSTTNLTKDQPKNSKLEVEENPKVLTAWTPKVVYDAKSKFKLGLIFQGKLLNEAGHVVHRKFTTDVIARRLSAALIETVNHEFYKLLGYLNDNKHTVPKELIRQCRYGCPAKIEQFCLTWKTLQQDDVQEVDEKLHDATMDLLNAPVSSRGRRILPPLCYWTGERISLKDNNPVYSPGNSQESSFLSLTDNSKEFQKNMNIEERKKQKVNSKNTSKKQNVNKQTLLPESNKISDTNKNQMIEKTQASKKSPKIKITNDLRSVNSKKARKSVSNKRRLAQKLTFSSTSDSSNEQQEISPRKRARNSQTNENADPEAPSRYTMTLRKRQKIETASNRILRGTTKSRHYEAYYSPTKRFENQEKMCTFYQDIPQSKDFLSENEVSSI